MTGISPDAGGAEKWKLHSCQPAARRTGPTEHSIRLVLGPPIPGGGLLMGGSDTVGHKQLPPSSNSFQLYIRSSFEEQAFWLLLMKLMASDIKLATCCGVPALK